MNIICDCHINVSYYAFHHTVEGEDPHLNVSVRLVDTSGSNLTAEYEGRVEILYRDLWGTICNNQWTINDAHVVCRLVKRLSSYDHRHSGFNPSTELYSLSCNFVDLVNVSIISISHFTRMLGYTQAIRTGYGSTYGRAKGVIWLSGVN